MLEGVRKLKRFKRIYISDECRNAWREFSTVSYKEDKDGRKLEDEFTIDPHAIDSVRYAIEDYEVGRLRGQNARGR